MRDKISRIEKEKYYIILFIFNVVLLYLSFSSLFRFSYYLLHINIYTYYTILKTYFLLTEDDVYLLIQVPNSRIKTCKNLTDMTGKDFNVQARDTSLKSNYREHHKQRT